jgi:hypothetical protein
MLQGVELQENQMRDNFARAGTAGALRRIDGEPAVRPRIACPARVRALWRRARTKRTASVKRTRIHD